MTGPTRPLSPHLQIYRPQWTSILSILHRATGLALAGGTVLLVWWVVATALGAEHYAVVQSVIGTWFGQLVLLAFSWALFYHLCNGIRHLFWDAGYGFELRNAFRTGWLAVAGSLVLTVLAWAIGLSGAMN